MKVGNVCLLEENVLGGLGKVCYVDRGVRKIVLTLGKYLWEWGANMVYFASRRRFCKFVSRKSS